MVSCPFAHSLPSARVLVVVSMICVLTGIACLSIGQVSWILLPEKSGRARITTFGFRFSILLALIGHSRANGASHGGYRIFSLPLYPLIPIAFVLPWMNERQGQEINLGSSNTGN